MQSLPIATDVVTLATTRWSYPFGWAGSICRPTIGSLSAARANPFWPWSRRPRAAKGVRFLRPGSLGRFGPKNSAPGSRANGPEPKVLETPPGLSFRLPGECLFGLPGSPAPAGPKNSALGSPRKEVLMTLKPGVRVYRPEDPRHIGKVIGLNADGSSQVLWEDSGWISDEQMLIQIPRVLICGCCTNGCLCEQHSREPNKCSYHEVHNGN
jgi:hypothetical protein